MTDTHDSQREPMAQSARRAEVVGLCGLGLQVAFFAILLAVALWNASQATFVTAFFVLGGVIIWLAIVLLYHQEKLVYLEALEAEQIGRDREAIGAEAIFTESRAGVDTLLVAKTRLEWMQKWLLPIAASLSSIYLIAMGVGLFQWYLTQPVGSVEWPELKNASASLAFVGGVAFLSFLFSRYAVGMARIGPMWRLMRAGGSFLTGNALASALVAGMLGFAAYGKTTPEQVLAKIIPIVMCVIGAEFILNLILDVYRPRKAGEVERPAFDSRLLGLISEPGGIARTIADAVNYQFGFEVSKTWFYQLLQRWAIVLAGAAVLILFLMTSLVIVEPDELAIVERFGEPLGLDVNEKKVATLGPGIHIKAPWPIDQARRYPVDHVHTILLGFGPWNRRNAPNVPDVPKLILWTNPIHGPGEELDFVMPVPPEVQEIAVTQPGEALEEVVEGGDIPAVNLIRVSLPVMYRIRDLYQYAFHYTSPETLIESAAYGELVRYVSSRDLDTMLAEGREVASEALRKAIQRRCDALGVGVEIVFSGIQNIHPPQKTAKEFEAYLNARYEKGASIARAEGAVNGLLSRAAGSRARAERMGKAIDRVQDLIRNGASTEKIAEARVEADRVFAERLGGQAAKIVAIARADRWTRENAERGRSLEFLSALPAHQVSPKLYRTRRIVEALTGALRGARKYVFARDGEVYVRYDARIEERVQLEDIDYNVPPG